LARRRGKDCPRRPELVRTKSPRSQLHITRAGVLELTDGPGLTDCYSLSDLATSQMCQKLGIPVGYYRRLSGEMKALVSNRLLGCRDSPPPVTWLATTMHYSHNEDEIRFDGVKNSIRENAREAATNIPSRTRQRSGDSRIRRIVSSTASTNRRASSGSRSA